MNDPTPSPRSVFTNINDVDNTTNMEDAVDTTKTNDVINATNTGPPTVSSGAQAIPPTPTPATTTTPTTTTTTTPPPTKVPDALEKTTTTTTTPTQSTSSPSSPPASTNTPLKGSKPLECPDLFSVSSEEFIQSDGVMDADHQHTIIINNKNQAVIFDHKTVKKSRGDEDAGSRGDDDDHSNHSYVHARINSRERTPGSIVTAICSHGSVPLTVTFLECQGNGKWNGTLPHCRGSLDVSSNTLYFSVIGGVCGATILILALLYYIIIKTRRREKGPTSPPLDPDKAIYVDPYAVGERLYSIPAPVHYTRGDITYAKPQIYSTYLNPSFYEDAYQRWRRQEQQVSEKLYDSPFINSRPSQQWGDNPDTAWTLNRGDKHNVDKLQIPRAKISAMDQGSVRSHDSVSTLTFTGGPRPQRVVYGRSPSIASSANHPPVPRYNTGQMTRHHNTVLEPAPGLHLVKAFDEAPPPNLQEFEFEPMPDGRTPF